MKWAITILGWVALVFLGLFFFILVGSGYFIEIGESYVMSYAPESPQDGVYLKHRASGRILAQRIEGYRGLDGSVAGKSSKGLFLANPDGEILYFSDDRAWLAICQGASGDFDGSLAKPSLLKCGMVMRALCVLGVLIAGMVYLLLDKQLKRIVGKGMVILLGPGKTRIRG